MDVVRTSLQYGISCLKRINYDRNELEQRWEEVQRPDSKVTLRVTNSVTHVTN